jgi:hypothetical protein
VQHSEDRQTAGPAQSVEGGEQRHLVSQVEMLGRLVEQQEPRLLSQGHGHQHPLPLTTRQLVDPPPDQVQCVGVDQGALDRVRVLRPGPEPGAGVRGTAHLDQLLDPEAVGQGGQLGKERHTLGHLSAGPCPHGLPVEGHAPRTRCCHPDRQPEERGLAAAVGAEQGDHLAG